MEKQPERQEANKEKQNPLCEECKEKPWKYKCPGCNLRSCSLPCVNSHKKRTACTGKRNRTQFVPLSQFDDNLLLSDYNLLEETKRVAEAAHRMRICVYPQFKPSFHLQRLRRAAADRRTRLLFLPSGMSKREKNESRYDHRYHTDSCDKICPSIRSKSLSWTIEWRFHSTDVILLDNGVHEDTILSSVVEKHLQPGPCNHQLRQFYKEPLDFLRFFIRKHPGGHKSPFWQLDIRAPLRQQLADIVILEYPVIYVFLPSHHFDFEGLKLEHSDAQRSEIKGEVSNPSPKGVTFRIEEIEEENSFSDSQVCDVMNNATSSSTDEAPNCKLLEKALDDSTNVPIFAIPETNNHANLSSKCLGPGFLGDIEFDLDQGLQDTYSDIIAQMNPDDFFDFEAEFAKEAGIKDTKIASDSRGIVVMDEEFEEGEIAG